jgi:16S rRNA (cytidine1402-2'-O)-methyltransferase
LELCKSRDVILVSDCGTPGFEDPGPPLVKACRVNNVQVSALPGPSSLALLISLSSEKLSEFLVRGFLPRDPLQRQRAWEKIQRHSGPQILLETPYRCQQFSEEIAKHCSDRSILFACELTTSREWIFEGVSSHLPEALRRNFGEKPKLEFCVLIYGVASINS